MRSRTLFLLAAAGSIVLAGCAGRVASYSGPRRPEPQIAVLPHDEAQSQIRVVSVDGRRLQARRADVELLPGRRVIEVVYAPPNTARSYPVQVAFEAKAGHRYALTAQMLKGRVNDDGFWGGKYQVVAYDLAGRDLHGVREVGRSPGPEAVAEIR